MHFSRGAHALPHAPQFALSFWTLVQNPPASIWQPCSPAPHTDTHAPCEHSVVPGHALAHAPQFPGSLVSATHLPPHDVCVPAHDVATSPLHAAPTTRAM